MFSIKNKIFILSFLVLLFAHNNLLAFVHPCFCVEHTSQKGKRQYLKEQTKALDGYITPDINKAIDKAKKTLKDLNDSYIIMLKNEKLLLSIIEDEQKMIFNIKKNLRIKEQKINIILNKAKSKILKNEIIIEQTVNKTKH